MRSAGGRIGAPSVLEWWQLRQRRHVRRPLRELTRRALALFALVGAGRSAVACSDGAASGGVPGDGGATDGTVTASDAVVATPDAADARSDAADAGFDATVDGPDGAVVDLDAIEEADAGCAVDAGPLDDAQVALGAQIVSAHRCTSCHGEALSGNFDGVPSPTTIGGTAYPPNLTSDPATGLGCWTNDEIENAFLNGIDNQGMPLCPPMPRFGHLADGGGIDPTQAPAVVQYLRSLPIASQEVPSTPDCPQTDAQAEAAADAPSEAPADAAGEGGADAGAGEGGD